MADSPEGTTHEEAGAPADLKSVERPYPSSGIAWYTVAVLLLVYVFSFLDRSILGLLVKPIRDDLNISDTQMSYLMGFSFAVFYVFFGIPLGRLADSRNRKRIISLGLLVWTVATALSGTANRYLHLLLFRMGVGVGEASLSPSAYSMITDLFPKRRLATALSVYSIGIYIGGGMSIVIGGNFIAWANANGPFSFPLLGEVQPWQMVFFLIGSLGFFPLAILLLTVREPLRRGLASRAGGKVKPVPFRDVFEHMMKNRRTLFCLFIGSAILSFSSYGISTWALEFMRRVHDWSPQQIGNLIGINGMIIGTLGVVSGGLLSDWLQKRGHRNAPLKIALFSAIGWMPTGLLYPLLPAGNGYYVFGLMLPTIFMTSLPAGSSVAALQQIMPNEMRAQASAVYLFVINLLGLGLGPSAIAWVTDYVLQDEMKLGYSFVLVGGIAHCIAAALFLFGMKPYVESVKRAEAWGEGPAQN